MRVLFLDVEHAWDGSARAFAAAARGLAARGHHVTFVCPPDSPVEERLDYAAYEVLPLDLAGAWPLAAWKLRHVLALRFVEVVFVHRGREHLLAAAASRMAGRAALMRRVPSGQAVTVTRRDQLALRLAPTGWMFSAEEALHAAPPELARRIPPAVVTPGVDVGSYDAVRPAARSALGAGGTERMIVCLYDLTSRVRAALALRTVALLAPLHPQLGLVFVGPGSDSEDLRMHAAALGITRRVSFLGERDDLLSIIRAADLGWVASQGDNALFAYLDLLALRVPVLAERDGMAQRYVANGITGLLLTPDDPPGTAAAVARALAHEEERGAMGAAARARVSRDFTAEGMVDAFERAALGAADRTLWLS
ncbi:MAG: glycosyltransferase [Gemmatimonadaceae bacterium]